MGTCKKTEGLTTVGRLMIKFGIKENILDKTTFLINQKCIDSDVFHTTRIRRREYDLCTELDVKIGRCGSGMVRASIFTWGVSMRGANCSLVFDKFNPSAKLAYNFVSDDHYYYESINLNEYIPEFPIITEGDMSVLQAVYPRVDFGLLTDISYTEMKYREGYTDEVKR